MINKNREFLFDLLPKNSICMEIGVWKGDFTELVVKHNEPKEYHLVDPWAYQPSFPNRFYSGKIAKNQKDMDDIFEGVKDRFKNIDSIVYNRIYSEKILENFKENYFDWIYVDGNHSYKPALVDIQNSYKLIKDGGYIVVDDYNSWSEVNRATNDFIKDNKNNITNVIKKENQALIKIKK